MNYKMQIAKMSLRERIAMAFYEAELRRQKHLGGITFPSMLWHELHEFTKNFYLDMADATVYQHLIGYSKERFVDEMQAWCQVVINAKQPNK